MSILEALLSGNTLTTESRFPRLFRAESVSLRFHRNRTGYHDTASPNRWLMASSKYFGVKVMQDQRGRILRGRVTGIRVPGAGFSSLGNWIPIRGAGLAVASGPHFVIPIRWDLPVSWSATIQHQGYAFIETGGVSETLEA
jgi:hypothetical protein